MSQPYNRISAKTVLKHYALYRGVGRQVASHRSFLWLLFITALSVRLLVATAIFVFQWQDFFGGDAKTYDMCGYCLRESWEGHGFCIGLVEEPGEDLGQGARTPLIGLDDL